MLMSRVGSMACIELIYLGLPNSSSFNVTYFKERKFRGHKLSRLINFKTFHRYKLLRSAYFDKSRGHKFQHVTSFEVIDGKGIYIFNVIWDFFSALALVFR